MCRKGKLPRRQYINLRPSLRAERTAYQNNLRLLIQEFERKYFAQVDRLGEAKAADQAGDDVFESYFRLDDFMGGLNPVSYREGYLTEIFRYWRTVATADEARKFEDV